MEVILGSPRGFCAGVVRAIDIVELAIERLGAPIYVRHEIIHNPFVVDGLRKKGAVFVDHLSDVPRGETVIFSAHGVSPKVRERARERGLRILDATCPLVTKVHIEAMRYAGDGYTVLLVGHRGHPETIGTKGEAPSQTVIVGTVDEATKVKVADPGRVAVLTQTTLSVDDTKEVVAVLKQRFPGLVVRNDICYATSNRQLAAKALAKQADVVLVIGAKNSSNSNRLREVAQAAGVTAYLVNGSDEIDDSMVQGASRIGIVSGASTPELLVDQVIEKLKPNNIVKIELVQENVTFALPPELR